MSPAALIGGTLLFALAAMIGWGVNDGYQINAAARAVETMILGSIASEKILLEVEPDRSTGTIEARGVAFGSVDLSKLRSRVRRVAAPYSVKLHIVTGDPK